MNTLNFHYYNHKTFFFSFLIISISVLIFSFLDGVLRIIIPVTILGLYWIYICIVKEYIAFYFLQCGFLLFYYRISLFPAKTRASFSVVDFLWAIYFLVWIFKKCKFKCKYIPSNSNIKRNELFGFLLYLLPTIFLPILGILIYDFPFSFSSPGVRQVEWVSFAFISYDMVKKYGRDFVVFSFWCLFFCLIIQAIYALIQTGCAIDILPDYLLFFDNLHHDIGGRSWFTKVRVTGLLLNPNGFGHLSWLFFFITFSLYINNIFKNISFFLFPLCFVLVILSGSRSAIIGLFLGCGFIFCILKKTTKNIRTMIVSILCLIVIVYFILPFLPTGLEDRFSRLISLIQTGDVNVENNAIGRVYLWQNAWTEYMDKYFWGTWVPPSYALKNAIDSYYIYLTVMGTPLYLSIFFYMILNLISIVNTSSNMYNCFELKAISVTIIGWVGAILGSSIGSSPFLLSHIIVPFWTFLGMFFGLRSISIRNPKIRDI